jgi:hypothetical protein
MAMKNVLSILFMLCWLPLGADSQARDLDMEFKVKEKTHANVHGFFDATLKTDYITPRGLLVTNKGLTTQIIAGLVLDVYKNPEPAAFLNKVAVIGFIWNDLSSRQHNHTVGSWNECDWGAGVSLTALQDWTLGAQYLEFLSPPGNFKKEQNIEFLVAYDDTKWQFPVALQPYAKIFWAVSGDSTVVVGKRGRTFDIELGIIPTVTKSYLTVKIPTWITVGPSSFWNGGNSGLKHNDKNFGVFSTGLQFQIPITFIPTDLGSWNIHAGVQYYHLINDSLLQAQVTTLGVKSRHSAHRNVYVASIGIGFSF